MDIDLEELAGIIELLDKTDFTDFQFEKGDLRIRVRRGGAVDEPAPPPAAAETTAQQAAQPAPTAAAAPATSSEAVGSEPAAAQNPQISESDEVVTAPMLGTFYRSPKPGEASFVEVGDKVGTDSVLCIVEAMKLMNSVSAGTEGEVTAILARDGDLLDFDQPLFAIRPLS